MQATRYQAEDEAVAAEELFESGWTDGLPVVVPTPERVGMMLATGGLDPDAVLGTVGPLNGTATVEKVAVNAVMAGCQPDWFPVVIAAVRAVSRPEFDIGEIQSTTHGLGPVVVVNGPAREICGGIASGWGALGAGHRPNVTIGRALRLVLMNIGGGRPGVTDMALHGQPGKIACCFAEAEEESPFAPLHTTFGFAAEDSAVVVAGVESPHSVVASPNRGDPEAAERLVRVIGRSIANAGSNNTYFGTGNVLVVLNPDHAQLLADFGYTRESLRARVCEEAVTPRETLESFAPLNPVRGEEPLVRAIRDERNLLIAVAGGTGVYSQVMNSWGGGTYGNVAVAQEIEIDQACELPGTGYAP